MNKRNYKHFIQEENNLCLGGEITRRLWHASGG